MGIVEELLSLLFQLSKPLPPPTSEIPPASLFSPRRWSGKGWLD
jgi:hypothetical protein